MTATPVDKTYIMLMVADMSRAMRFYTEAFDVKVVMTRRIGASSALPVRTSRCIPAAAAPKPAPASASRCRTLMSPWSELPRSAGGSPLHRARDPMSASELPNLPTPKAT